MYIDDDDNDGEEEHLQQILPGHDCRLPEPKGRTVGFRSVLDRFGVQGKYVHVILRGSDFHEARPALVQREL